MVKVTIQEAQAQLYELIHRLNVGDELVITENDQPVAKLARTAAKNGWPCKAGSARARSRWPPTLTPSWTTSRSIWSEPTPRRSRAALVPQR